MTKEEMNGSNRTEPLAIISFIAAIVGAIIVIPLFILFLGQEYIIPELGAVALWTIVPLSIIIAYTTGLIALTRIGRNKELKGNAWAVLGICIAILSSVSIIYLLMDYLTPV